VFCGAIFVLDDNIDTDQIIPAEYLTLVPLSLRSTKTRQLRSGWITGSLRQFRSTRRNKDALPHHYRWGKLLVAVLPETHLLPWAPQA